MTAREFWTNLDQKAKAAPPPPPKLRGAPPPPSPRAAPRTRDPSPRGRSPGPRGAAGGRISYSTSSTSSNKSDSKKETLCLVSYGLPCECPECTEPPSESAGLKVLVTKPPPGSPERKSSNAPPPPKQEQHLIGSSASRGRSLSPRPALRRVESKRSEPEKQQEQVTNTYHLWAAANSKMAALLAEQAKAYKHEAERPVTMFCRICKKKCPKVTTAWCLCHHQAKSHDPPPPQDIPNLGQFTQRILAVQQEIDKLREQMTLEKAGRIEPRPSTESEGSKFSEDLEFFERLSVDSDIGRISPINQSPSPSRPLPDKRFFSSRGSDVQPPSQLLQRAASGDQRLQAHRTKVELEETNKKQALDDSAQRQAQEEAAKKLAQEEATKKLAAEEDAKREALKRDVERKTARETEEREAAQEIAKWEAAALEELKQERERVATREKQAEKEAKEAAERQAAERVAAEKAASEAAAKEAAEREAAAQEAARKAKETAEREAAEKEEAAQRAKEAAEKEEAARKAKEVEAAQKAKEAAEIEAARKAKEATEREAKEVAAREVAEREAAERAAKEAAEKAAKEAAEKAAAEAAEKEALAKAAAEKEAREKEARETAEREAREKEAREAAEKEAKEVAEREAAAREAAEKEAREREAAAEREAAESEAREVAKREEEEAAKKVAAEKVEREAQQKEASNWDTEEIEEPAEQKNNNNKNSGEEGDNIEEEFEIVDAEPEGKARKFDGEETSAAAAVIDEFGQQVKSARWLDSHWYDAVVLSQNEEDGKYLVQFTEFPEEEPLHLTRSSLSPLGAAQAEREFGTDRPAVALSPPSKNNNNSTTTNNNSSSASRTPAAQSMQLKKRSPHGSSNNNNDHNNHNNEHDENDDENLVIKSAKWTDGHWYAAALVSRNARAGTFCVQFTEFPEQPPMTLVRDSVSEAEPEEAFRTDVVKTRARSTPGPPPVPRKPDVLVIPVYVPPVPPLPKVKASTLTKSQASAASASVAAVAAASNKSKAPPPQYATLPHTSPQRPNNSSDEDFIANARSALWSDGHWYAASVIQRVDEEHFLVQFTHYRERVVLPASSISSVSTREAKAVTPPKERASEDLLMVTQALQKHYEVWSSESHAETKDDIRLAIDEQLKLINSLRSRAGDPANFSPEVTQALHECDTIAQELDNSVRRVLLDLELQGEVAQPMSAEAKAKFDDMLSCTVVLTKGQDLRYGKKGKPKVPHFVSCSPDLQTLRVEKKQRLKLKSGVISIRLADINGIQKGMDDTNFFVMYQPERFVFLSLELEADTKAVRDLWVKELQKAIGFVTNLAGSLPSSRA